MTGFTEPTNDYKNPNDTSTMQCGQEGVTGGAIVRTADDLVASTDATALAALPAGHSVARFLRAGDDHEGTFFVGGDLEPASNVVRVAARWYIYRTPTFDFKLEGTCINAKISQHPFLDDEEATRAFVIDVSHVEDGLINFHTYNFLTTDGWVNGADCCTGGPGPDFQLPVADKKGKWWRYEIVLTNMEGPNFRIQMYGVNVTDDPETEYTIIDLHDNGQVDNLTPPSRIYRILSNNHRFSDGNICRGWIGLSHYMLAGWTTDAGQRIGAASEIEGGEGGGGGPSETMGNRGGRRRGLVGLLR